jgi:hypothetical protein
MIDDRFPNETFKVKISNLGVYEITIIILYIIIILVCNNQLSICVICGTCGTN